MSLSSTSTYITLTSADTALQRPDSVCTANLPYDPVSSIPVLPLTKAVVTLGPACSDNPTIDEFIRDGVTGFRMNMSHVNTKDDVVTCLQTVARVRKYADERGKEVAVFADMKGSEFRVVLETPETKIPIFPGDNVRITTRPGISRKDGSLITLHLEAPEGYDLIRDIRRHNEGRLCSEKRFFVVIDDARVRIELNPWHTLFDSSDNKNDLLGTVRTGDFIRHNKGTNFPELHLPHLPGLTKADSWILSQIFSREFVLSAWEVFRKNNAEAKLVTIIDAAIKNGLVHLLGFDYVAPSFVRTVEDLDLFKHALDVLLAKHVGLIAKIETPEAVAVIQELMAHTLTRGVMVARGDLAAQAGLVSVPYFQQKILDAAREVGRFSIVATDVLGTMTEGNEFATRAEHDGLYRIMTGGASAFMLSNETAVGKHPSHVVRYALGTFADAFMEGIQAKLPVRAEQRRRVMEKEEKRYQHLLTGPTDIERFRQAQIYLDQMRLTIGADNDHFIDGLVLWSHYGRSARFAAQSLPSMPIYVVTDNIRVAREAALTRGLFPIRVSHRPKDGAELQAIIRGTLRLPPGKTSYNLAVMHNLGNGG